MPTGGTTPWGLPDRLQRSYQQQLTIPPTGIVAPKRFPDHWRLNVLVLSMGRKLILASLLLGAPVLVLGCRAQTGGDRQTNPADANGAGGQTGELRLAANGEDFVRQGFTSKNGWQIAFERVAVTLGDVTAYQSDPPFDPDQGGDIQAVETVKLVTEPVIVDLAEGPENADPIEVTTQQAPAGEYDALAWSLVTANNATIAMEGTAQKDGRTINFQVSLARQMRYWCGAYVGEQRKGILEPGGTAAVEATFHFDHLFGDAEAPADGDLNQNALGFEPLAAFAEDGQLQADANRLRSQLSDADYQTLQNALQGLGHVGEGHCRVNEVTASAGDGNPS